MSEWREVARALLGSWPHGAASMGEDGIAAYLEECRARGLTADGTLDAIRSCPASQKFPPSVPELAGVARKDPSAPTFTEAYALIYGKGGVLRARPKYAGRLITDEDRNRAMLDRAAELHPLVAAFVNRYGLHRLRMLEVDDPEYGELRRKELAGEWDQFCEAMEGRDVAALVSGRREGLGRLDPMAALGLEQPQIEQEATATGEGQ